MLLFGGTLLIAIAPFVNIQFLGSSLTFMMVYVWGRRHQVRVDWIGCVRMYVCLCLYLLTRAHSCVHR